MNPNKINEEQRTKKPSLNQRLRSNWRNRMNSVQVKMSIGAQQIYRMIKDRWNWGNKDFPKNHRK